VKKTTKEVQALSDGRDQQGHAAVSGRGGRMKIFMMAFILAGNSYAQADLAVYRLSAGALVGANVADLVSSLNAPGHETNPLIGNSRGSLIAFKIAPPAIALGIEWLILRHHRDSPVARTVASLLNFAMAAGPSYAAVHNWRLK